MKRDDLEKQVKSILADQIGVDESDIKNEDYLDEDLHMGPSEIADFFAKLDAAGFNTGNIEKPNETSVEELIEALTSHLVE